MNFKSYASGSSGNFYVLQSRGSRLAIEAGLSFKNIQQHLGFKASSLHGVLLTHSHADHSRSAVDFANAGVNVFASIETLGDLGLAGSHRAHAVCDRSHFIREDLVGKPSGGWVMVPFDCVHDVPTLGFLIGAPDGDQLLFATDTAFVPVKTEGCTHFAIECNYSQAILAASSVSAVARSRIVRTHMGLENVLDLIEANDTSRLREIHLLHLSDGHSDAEAFARAVADAALGVDVFVAPRGGSS